MRRLLDARAERAAGRARGKGPEWACMLSTADWFALGSPKNGWFVRKPNILPRGLVCVENQLFPSRPHLIMGAREKLIGDVGVDVRLKNLRCEAATICGGGPGLFSLANDADRGEPTNE